MTSNEANDRQESLVSLTARVLQLLLKLRPTHIRVSKEKSDYFYETEI